MRLRFSAVAALVVLSCCLAGCVNDVTDTLIEIPLGKLSELAVGLEFQMERDPLVDQYVDRLGAEQKLLARRKNVPYRFDVVLNEAPNAFAIPYGGIYVTKGLLRFAESEDEIGFVVGHEIGHVERRHSSLAFQRNLLFNLGLSLITTNNTRNWLQYAQLGNYFLDLHFSRENESSADREGAVYALNSGHNPHEGLQFFRRLDARYGATPRFWSYLQTHPINRDRISDLKQQRPLSLQDAAVLTQIADGYRVRSRYPSAEQIYRRALTVDPNHGAAYVGLARVAAWRGDTRLAQERFDEAVRHGVDPATITAEADATAARSAAPPEVTRPADAAAVQQASAALEELGTTISATRSLIEPVSSKPLDADQQLVRGHELVGNQLDQLYQMQEQLPRPVQEQVAAAQKLRALALTAAAEVGAAQAGLAVSLDAMAENRERLLLRLADQPTVAEVELARQELESGRAAAGELRASADELRRLAPQVSDQIHDVHNSIDQLYHQVRTANGRRSLPTQVDFLLSNAERAANEAARRGRAAQQGMYATRLRTLQDSIDITLVDLNRPGRAAAQRIMERFLLADNQAVPQVLQTGLSYGEAALVLGMAKSGKAQPAALVTNPADPVSRAAALSQLRQQRTASPGNVAIMLRLIDRTLKAEFEPGTAYQPVPVRPDAAPPLTNPT